MKRVLPMLVVALTVMGGVGFVGSVRSSEEAAASVVFPELLLTPDEATELRALAVAEAPSTQRAALDDGLVARAEYAAAAQATVACIEEAVLAGATAAGFDVDVAVIGPTLSEDQFEYSWEYDVLPIGVAAEDIEEATAVTSSVDRDCQREYLSSVEQVYMVGRRTSPVFINEAAEGLVRCLHEEAGVPMDRLHEANAEAVFRAGVAESRDLAEATRCMASVPSLSAILDE